MNHDARRPTMAKVVPAMPERYVVSEMRQEAEEQQFLAKTLMNQDRAHSAQVWADSLYDWAATISRDYVRRPTPGQIEAVWDCYSNLGDMGYNGFELAVAALLGPAAGEGGSGVVWRIYPGGTSIVFDLGLFAVHGGVKEETNEIDVEKAVVQFRGVVERCIDDYQSRNTASNQNEGDGDAK